ncbi:MAG: hypothetical protein L0H96_21850 [Humibacillus sp.]|nr:hypothetical protein [Humibacillus sp.]MDN5779541.1 hypothetical protein [Humibacillus sp.]
MELVPPARVAWNVVLAVHVTLVGTSPDRSCIDAPPTDAISPESEPATGGASWPPPAGGMVAPIPRDGVGPVADAVAPVRPVVGVTG